MYGIILTISILVTTVAIFLWLKGNRLLTSGKKAKAIIFKNHYKPGTDIEFDAYYPVVRFLTDNQEWITQELSIGYSPAKAVGTELEVIYDPKNPNNVEPNSTFQLRILPRILVVIGVCGLVFGIWGYLK
jgi:hypothetical protein